MKSWIILFFAFTIPSATHAQEQNLKLWYNAPAEKWTEALPIGNGRLGAMIYGNAQQEHIQFNEETLWNGSPREYARKGAAAYLPEIRKLISDGKQAAAEALAEKHFMGTKSNESTYDSLKKIWIAKVITEQNPSRFEFNDSQWREIKLPTPNGWESAALEGIDGAVWFRTAFDLPDNWKGKNLIIALGRIRDLDITYVNGMKIGSTENTENRIYKIDAASLRPGKNLIAIQVLNFNDKGGLVGSRNNQKALLIYPEEASPEAGIALGNTWKYWVQEDMPPAFPKYQADYQPFGDVWLDFKNIKDISNYKRDLDISTALASVKYTSNGIDFTREYFASAPHQVMAMHVQASKPASISVNAFFKTPHTLSTIKKIDASTLALSLQVKNGALRGVSYLHIEAIHGKVTVTDHDIQVENADDVTFYLIAATNFKNYKDVSGDPESICKKTLRDVGKVKYEEIKAKHIQDYQKYFNTLSLNLGKTEKENLTTRDRLIQYTSTTDPSLITLYFQYGRYLLISSSRPGTQPANLQGIWNNLLLPPWGSKYTTNINVEMNYWPVELLNLSPCVEPLLGLISDVSNAGQATAKFHYNAPGWVVHHNTDLWRGTAPINAANHGIWVTGGAWLSHHLWEHYLFKPDKAFLQEAYPIMKGAAEFFTVFLVRDSITGWLISTPSNSPEQGGLVAGPTMDHQIIRDLFKNCIRASEILNIDVEFRQKLDNMYKQIAPNQIGKYGQLQEWVIDKDDTTNRHRHVSHLWGVYPGTDITVANPEIMKAAKQSLHYRGDGGTGWSLAWKTNLWARFKDGDHTMLMIDKLLQPAYDTLGNERGGAYFNLFDAHPPFQIDGNFGGASGIAEMLIQSHEPYIELLPALPSTLPKGEIKGVCARGGFVLSIQWEKGKLKSAEVTSLIGNACFLKYGTKEIHFDTQAGKAYKLNSDLKSTN